MLTPKVEFRYSWPYDSRWKDVYDSLPSAKKTPEYPTRKRTARFIDGIEDAWRPVERNVLTEMSRVARLSWKERSIRCYVVGWVRPFSDPLTLGVYKHANRAVDVLTHELIHQLFSQPGNRERAGKAWSYIQRKYRTESRLTRTHIPLHAIHKQLYLTCFNEARLRADQEFAQRAHDYQRSWAIVESEGYQNILKDFTSRIEQKSD